MRLRVILNPAAGGGAAARKKAAILSALERAGLQPDCVHTEGPGDAARLVRGARSEGIACVAVVGGDGTLHDAAQGYLGPDGTHEAGPDLALIPSGTGGDFRRTFGLSDSFDDAAERIARATPRPIDLGVLTLTGHDGAHVQRAFINITSFGIGGLTDKIVNASPKWLGGRASFFIGSLRALLVYRNQAVRVKVDGRVFLEAPVFNVALANGRFFGGGMMVAPEADPADGLIDVIAMHDQTRLEGAGLSRFIYQGTHLDQPGVKHTRGRVIDAEPLSAKAEVLIDADGETPGRLPLRAELRPAALRLRI